MLGRPTDYRIEFNEQVVKLCKLGATDKEIADFFEVTETTINNWKVEHPDFFESIKRGKVLADAEVADKLFKRATGYEYKETTFEKIGAKEAALEVGEEGMEKIEDDIYKKKVVLKEMPPDTVAGIFWLKNRRGKVNSKDGQRWADKQEITGENGAPLQPAVIQVVSVDKAPDIAEQEDP